MKIFVSFSSDDRDLVEPVVEALRGAGHSVFYDSSSLPPSDTYDHQIEKAVKSCDAVVFCVSENSIRQGAYSLTELKFAREKWPTARNRVLPLMIRETDFGDVPAYLKAVTLLRPVGNAAAETVSAVSRMAAAQKAPRRRWIAAGATMAVAAAAVFFFLPSSERSPDTVFDETIRPGTSVDVFNPGPVYKVSGTYRNPDPLPHFFVGASMEFSPALEGWEFTPLLENQMLELAPAQHIPFAGRLRLAGPLPDSETRWRLGIANESGTEYGSWQDWTQAGFAPDFEILSEEQGRRFVAAASTSGAVAVIHRDPAELVVGEQAVQLSGMPVAVAAFGDSIAVATLGPAELSLFSMDGLETRARFSLPKLKNEYDEPISTAVSSMALNDGHLWVTTDSGSGAAGLLVYDLAAQAWSIPPFDPYDRPDPDDLLLKSSPNGTIAGVSTATVPSSLYLLAPDKLVVFGGHDYEDVSSATDFAWQGENLLLRTGDGQIILSQIDGDRLAKIGDGKIVTRPWESGYERGDWAYYLIGGTLDATHLAINKRNSDGSRETEIVFATPQTTRTILHQRGAETVALTVTGGKLIAVLENAEQTRRMISANLQ